MFGNMFSQTVSKIVSEDLTDQINGSRQLFTISVPYDAASLRVFWNGIRQSSTEITVVSALTFSTTFQASIGNSLIVEYYKS